MRRIASAFVAGVLLAGGAGAQYHDPADPGAQVPSRPSPSFEPPDRRGVPERIDPGLRFTVRDRELFSAWAAAEYGKGKCPPGLIKKESHCLPRGQARKRYTIGLALPASVVPGPVPLDLTRRIGMPPIGYRYGMIDGDLVKLAVGSGQAVDAVDGFIPK